jgi:hypothetical protein
VVLVGGEVVVAVDALELDELVARHLGEGAQRCAALIILSRLAAA